MIDLMSKEKFIGFASNQLAVVFNLKLAMHKSRSAMTVLDYEY
jgi:hypothetical protein